MTGFAFRVWCFGLGLLVASGTAPAQSVLLLISDDQGLDAGCYGNPVIQTPNQDRLAREGVRFTHAFATVASCSASRSVILTGRFNHSTGQYGHTHRDHNFHALEAIQSLPRLLKDNGYTTGVVGKLHVKPASVYPYDYSVSGRETGGNRDVAAMARKAGEFFKEQSGRAFFLLVGYSDPHRSRRGFGNEVSYSGVEEVRYDPLQVKVPRFLPDQLAVRKELAEHYQAVSRLDQGIGLVLRELEGAGREKDTLVIYLSDNGIPFPGAKTNLYDSGVHLPLLVRSPKQTRKGLVNNAIVSYGDLLPTILDWTGTPPPKEELPGRSFLPILEEENPPGWDEAYLSPTFHEITMYYPIRGVRTRRYKYLLNLFPELGFPHASDLFASPTWKSIQKQGRMGRRLLESYIRRPMEELYDLDQDPDEVLNLAADPSFGAVLRELRRKVTSFRQKTDDPWLRLTTLPQRELF